jgi:hypothetical protein
VIKERGDFRSPLFAFFSAANIIINSINPKYLNVAAKISSKRRFKNQELYTKSLSKQTWIG